MQKNKRHKYYMPEKEKYLRLIVETNEQAAEICRRMDGERNRQGFDWFWRERNAK